MISFQQKWKIPGISVAIAKDGRLIYARGFGFADTTNKVPVTTNSLFRSASCGKTITAIGIMKLIENNKLSLKKYDAMKKYARELTGFLSDKLKGIKIYPNTDLFNAEQMK